MKKLNFLLKSVVFALFALPVASVQARYDVESIIFISQLSQENPGLAQEILNENPDLREALDIALAIEYSLGLGPMYSSNDGFFGTGTMVEIDPCETRSGALMNSIDINEQFEIEKRIKAELEQRGTGEVVMKSEGMEKNNPHRVKKIVGPIAREYEEAKKNLDNVYAQWKSNVTNGPLSNLYYDATLRFRRAEAAYVVAK